MFGRKRKGRLFPPVSRFAGGVETTEYAVARYLADWADVPTITNGVYELAENLVQLVRDKDTE